MTIRLGGALWLVAIAAVACSPVAPADPATLRFAAIPDQPAALVLEQHKPLVDRLCQAMKRSCTWVPADTYERLVDLVGRGEVDIAYFGGATYAQATSRHQVVALAMRDVDFRFTSVVVVRRDSAARSLDDLKARRFTFANRSSTSGHFMLRQRLLDRGLSPERHFGTVGFAATHEAAMHAVASGDADAAGINANVFYRRAAAGDPDALALRVLWQSPPYTDYVWAARPGLSASLRQTVVDAFLDLNPSNADDRAALAAEGAAGFVPAFPSDFREVTDVVRSLGRL